MDINEIIKRGIEKANTKADEELNELMKEENGNCEETRKRLRFYSSIDMDKEWQSFEQRRKPRKSKTIKLWWLGAAASLLIMIGFATFAINNEKGKNYDYALFDSSKVKPGIKAADVAEKGDTETVNVPRGAEYSLVLNDGTKVWLNSDSRLVYPKTFNGKERRVKLEGEAYFEVAHNAEKPFYVDLIGMSIHVTGTKFNVNARNGKNIDVTLVSGSIQMERANGKLMAVLQPNENFTAGLATKGYRVSEADINTDLAWHKGKFVFKEQTLSDIASQLSLWYNIDIIVPEDLKDRCYSGELNRYQTIEPLLKVLRLTGELEFIDRGNGKMEIIKKQ